MKKFFLALFFSMMFLCTSCAGNVTSETGNPEPAETETYPCTVDFLKTGKADAMVIHTQNHTVVIDCGEKSDGSKVLNCLNSSGTDTIDYLILTHYDQDHIGGAAKVINQLNISHILGANYTQKSTEYTRLSEAMSEKNLNMELVTKTTTFYLDDVTFEIYPCQRAEYQEGNDNNHSLIIKMTHHEEIFLFAGDAMQERLAEIMDIGDCTVLKEPYHGREIANLGVFLDNVTPEYAVISTDEETLSDTVTQALSERNIETYITFQDGNIRCISTGTAVRFTAGMNFKEQEET